MDTVSNRPPRLTGQLVLGVIIIAAGVLFTLENFGLVRSDDFVQFWPAGLIALGASKLWQARNGGGGVFGGWAFLLVGTWLLLENVAILRVSFWDVSPMLLVLMGAFIVWRGVRGRPAERTAMDANATVNAFAVMAGLNRGNNSKAFKGGELTAIMGGCEIDLRQAAIHGEAVIDVFAMGGGIEIRVPEDWSVEGRVTPLLAGFEDKTRPPQGATLHRLVIRGFVIMGGVEVSN